MSEECQQQGVSVGESVASVIQDQLRERQERLRQNDIITHQEVDILFIFFRWMFDSFCE